MTVYTAEDYARTADVVRYFASDDGSLPIDPDRTDRLLAALSIAALVCKEGVIEEALKTHIWVPIGIKGSMQSKDLIADDATEDDLKQFAAAIRKAVGAA